MTETSRTVLVSGASAGIGRAICLRLLEEGHRVIGVARDFGKFAWNGEGFLPVEIDLADLEALPQRLKDLSRQHSGIDAVVCNAGRGQFGSLEEFSYQQIRSLVDLNFTSQAYLVRALLPGMKERGRGDVVFIGSEAALSGGRRGAVYSASKSALRAFARSLRQESSRSGIRVCVVNPGMVRTGFFTNLPFAPGDEKDNALLPEEIARLVSFVLHSRGETVFDEINLSPLRKVLRFKDEKE